ncbi:MAG: hypothetical protein U1F43_15490 [Myxococcota bacterium]
MWWSRADGRRPAAARSTEVAVGDKVATGRDAVVDGIEATALSAATALLEALVIGEGGVDGERGVGGRGGVVATGGEAREERDDGGACHARGCTARRAAVRVRWREKREAGGLRRAKR